MKRPIDLTVSGAIINLLDQHGIGIVGAGKLLHAIDRTTMTTATTHDLLKKNKKAAEQVDAISENDREFHESNRRDALIHQLLTWAKTCEGPCPLHRKKVRRNGDHKFLWDALAQYLAKGPAKTKAERLERAINANLVRLSKIKPGVSVSKNTSGLILEIKSVKTNQGTRICIDRITHPAMTVQNMNNGWYAENERHEIILNAVLPEVTMSELQRTCEAARSKTQEVHVGISNLIDWAAYTGPQDCRLTSVFAKGETQTELNVEVPMVKIQVSE